MALLGRQMCHRLSFSILFFVLIQSNVFAYQFQVGNLQAWNIPTSTDPKVYTNWPKKLNFKIGDSLCKFISSKASRFLKKDQIFYVHCVLLQCSCIHQVKILWFKWRKNLTTPAIWKIQSCIWTMAIRYSTLLHRVCFTSPVVFPATVKNRRSFKFRCLPPTGLCHCRLLPLPAEHLPTLHLPIPPCLAEYRRDRRGSPRLHRRRWKYRFWLLRGSEFWFGV